MANNITVKDAAGLDKVLKTIDNSGVHTPQYALSPGESPDLGSTSEAAYDGTTGRGIIGTLKGIWVALTGTLSVRKSQQTVSPIVISNGQSLSATVDLGVTRAVGLETPATFEPTTISFQVSSDNTTFVNLYDATGTEKTVTVGVSRRIVLSPADFLGVRYIKIRGGTASSATTVSANRTVQIISEA